MTQCMKPLRDEIFSQSLFSFSDLPKGLNRKYSGQRSSLLVSVCVAWRELRKNLKGMLGVHP